LLAGIVVGASLVIALLMLSRARSSVFEGNRGFVIVSVVGLGVAVSVAAVVLNRDGATRGIQNRLPDSGISLATVESVSTRLRPAVPTAQSTSQIASVPSLVDGLKRRLESDPDNASGWALLAQSYAYTGQPELADQALQRAVALGLDEADLRQRVEGARRDPHSGLAIDAAR
jgi:cytochrome c-type biogenesis protein CcmH/NrfG